MVISEFMNKSKCFGSSCSDTYFNFFFFAANWIFSDPLQSHFLRSVESHVFDSWYTQACCFWCLTCAVESTVSFHLLITSRVGHHCIHCFSTRAFRDLVSYDLRTLISVRKFCFNKHNDELFWIHAVALYVGSFRLAMVIQKCNHCTEVACSGFWCYVLPFDVSLSCENLKVFWQISHWQLISANSFKETVGKVWSLINFLIATKLWKRVFCTQRNDQIKTLRSILTVL